jgi:hypothetical protein
MIETVYDGQELTSEFLDDLFISIREKVPEDQWVEIKKTPEMAVAGIKYLIDCGMFGAKFRVVFNDAFTSFKKEVIHEKRVHQYQKHWQDNISDISKETQQLIGSQYTSKRKSSNTKSKKHVKR